MDSSSRRPCIYLINAISGRGHLDMYARLYSECLLDQGYRVVLISQHDPGFSEQVANARPGRAERFAFYTRDGVKEGGYTFNRVPPPAAPQPANADGVASSILRSVDQASRRAAAASRRLRADGLEAVRDKLDPKRYSPYAAGVNFEHLTDEIQEATIRLGWKPDFLLFLYLDMMRQDAASIGPLEKLGVPFAGILFHPEGSYAGKTFRPERYFLCRNSRGAIFLNPEPIPEYTRRFPGQRFECFPDVTEDETLPEPSELVKRIRARAGKRSTVLQLGTLSPHKGIFDLVELIKRADPDQFFFAIVGEPMWDHYGDRKDELRAFLENPPEHSLAELGYLDDPRELNSLIEASDILYAVYRGDFKNSSNTITKAAVFRKPILVSDKFLMGERVRKYALGEAVKSGDVEDTLFWLEEIASRPPERFGFEACARDHSIAALNDALARTVKQWIKTPAGADAAALDLANSGSAPAGSLGGFAPSSALADGT